MKIELLLALMVKVVLCLFLFQFSSSPKSEGLYKAHGDR